MCQIMASENKMLGQLQIDTINSIWRIDQDPRCQTRDVIDDRPPVHLKSPLRHVDLIVADRPSLTRERWPRTYPFPQHEIKQKGELLWPTGLEQPFLWNVGCSANLLLHTDVVESP